MPAITSLDHLCRGALGAGSGGARRPRGRGLKRIAERIKNRRDAMRLAELDDRMLADIGLTRSDLRDAYSEPLWRDPSEVLARRAAERRGAGGGGHRLAPVTTVCAGAVRHAAVRLATRRPIVRRATRSDRLLPWPILPSANRPERRFPLPPSGCCARRPPAGAFFLSPLPGAIAQSRSPRAHRLH